MLENPTISELRARDLPKCSPDVFGELPEGTMSTNSKDRPVTLDVYAEQFTPGSCPHCGEESVDWTICHGLAACIGEGCHWQYDITRGGGLDA